MWWKQREDRKIYDGITALQHIISAYRESERRSAAAGFFKIYQQAKAGWPDIQPAKVPFMSMETEEARTDLLRVVRIIANELHELQSHDKIVHELWTQITSDCEH